MLYPNNYRKDFYCSNYDLINKYNLSSIYSAPKVKNVVLEFTLERFSSALDYSNTNEKDSELQYKTYASLYAITSRAPFIRSRVLSVSKTTGKEVEVKYAIKVIFTQAVDINDLIFSLLIENFSNIKSEGLKIVSPGNSGKDIVTSSNFSISANSFSNMDSFLDSNVPNVNSRDLALNFRFVCSSPNTKNVLISPLRNISLFWING